jgi:hypothetical protein
MLTPQQNRTTRNLSDDPIPPVANDCPTPNRCRKHAIEELPLDDLRTEEEIGKELRKFV